MTPDSGSERETPRRKFDDVASLFGTIVPPPSAVLRPIKDYAPVPLAPPAQPTPPPAPRTLAVPKLVQPEAAPKAEAKLEQAPPHRPRPTELPWPDAFEPRPNYRRREPRNWSWLLLIPVGFIAAVGITMVDPHTIRTWLDANVFHRTRVADIGEAPPLLSPPSAQPTAPPPAPVAAAPMPDPSIPTSPVPVPPGTQVSPPPVEPETAVPAVAAAPIHIMIQYRRNIPGAEGEARRVAALLQSYGGSIELHPTTSTVRSPTINYYNPADKAAATALATVLANEAANWIVRLSPTKYPLGTLDVWLP